MYDDNRKTLLHNMNAAAAVLEDIAGRIHLAAMNIRRARKSPSHDAADGRASLLALAVQFEQLADTLSSWATLLSNAATPVARNDDLSLLLPTMLKFSRLAVNRLAQEHRKLARTWRDLRPNGSIAQP